MSKIVLIMALAIGINLIAFIAPLRGAQNVSLLDLTLYAVDEDPNRNWVLTKATEKEGRSYLEKFDSSADDDHCWQLISVNNKPPTSHQQTSYQHQIKAPITLAELRGAMVEGSLKQISDDGVTVIFSFGLAPTQQDPDGSMKGKIFMDKQRLNIERVELRQLTQRLAKGST